MPTLLIGTGLISMQNAFILILKLLHTKPTISIAIAYTLSGFFLAGIALYFSYAKITQGELIAIAACAI